jgi:hypothetical protein
MLSVATLVAFTALSFGAGAQSRTATGSIKAPRGIVQDWSNQATIHSHPETFEEARAKGRLEQWRRNYSDPRFVLALMRRLELDAVVGDLKRKRAPVPPPTSPSGTLHRDWNNVLGGGIDAIGGVGTAGTYPAKFSFDINAAPSCANDFVVYTTGSPGADSSGTTFETRASAWSGNPSVGDTVDIGPTGTSRTIRLTAHASNNSGQFFKVSTTGAAGVRRAEAATNLAAAVNRWSGTTGITAAAATVNVTYTRTTRGNTVTIPITSSTTNYSPGAAGDGNGTGGQPTVIAFNQLYGTTCGGTVPYYPSTFFSYNTGTGAIAKTSPVISYFDGGKQIAFVQTNSSNQAELVLLKWSSASPGTPSVPSAAPTAVSLASYRTCTAPCMTTLTFSGTPNDIFSSPYVDYYADIAWIGADDGSLHKITGVFKGTPAEVTTGGFPSMVSSGNALSSPVFDFGRAQVMVGSARGVASGGMLHRVNASTGVSTDSAVLAIANSLGVRATPLVDSSANRSYAFVFDDGAAGDGVTCNASGPCQTVTQFVNTFGAGDPGNKIRVGFGGGGLNATFFNGTFDDAYYANSSPTGAMYVCGTAPNDASMAVLWKIPILNNVVGAPVQGASISATGFTGNCSPISEVKNGTHDYLFVSVPDHPSDGTATVCGTGAASEACLYMFDLTDLNGTAAGTGALWGTTNVPSAGLSVLRGTGGLIMDNISADPGTSQVYFSSLAADCDVAAGVQGCGNAHQASQAGLQ